MKIGEPNIYITVKKIVPVVTKALMCNDNNCFSAVSFVGRGSNAIKMNIVDIVSVNVSFTIQTNAKLTQGL